MLEFKFKKFCVVELVAEFAPRRYKNKMLTFHGILSFIMRSWYQPKHTLKDYPIDEEKQNKGQGRNIRRFNGGTILKKRGRRREFAVEMKERTRRTMKNDK